MRKYQWLLPHEVKLDVIKLRVKFTSDYKKIIRFFN